MSRNDDGPGCGGLILIVFVIWVIGKYWTQIVAFFLYLFASVLAVVMAIAILPAAAAAVWGACFSLRNYLLALRTEMYLERPWLSGSGSKK